MYTLKCFTFILTSILYFYGVVVYWPVSQLIPVYPVPQIHSLKLGMFSSSTQIPSFRHGSFSHSLTSEKNQLKKFVWLFFRVIFFFFGKYHA